MGCEPRDLTRTSTGRLVCPRGTVLLFVSMFLLTSCTATLRVEPALPPPSKGAVSPARIGVYITNTPKDEIPAGSGIWPGTTYRFAADNTVQDGLMQLTRRHFRNAGIAENAGDKRWDYVLEYTCEKPYVDGGTLRSQVPLKSTLRNPQTGREVQSLTLTGEGPAQDGRFMRFMFGRLAEKPALERSLNDAYSNLYSSVEGNLNRLGAEQSRNVPGKPYRKRDRPPE
jgi:hypothetical protein